MIKLEITKTKTNENFEKEMREYKSDMIWCTGKWMMPDKYITTDILSVKVTEEQFEAIRKAVLDVF